MKRVSPLRKFWRFLKTSPWLPWLDASPREAGDEDTVNDMLTPDVLKKMVRGIAQTRDEEITCEECFEQVDAFAEMVLAGKPAAEAMPLVEHHLSMCADCRAEFEALLDALRAA